MRKHLKMEIAAATSALALAIGIAACGGDSESSTPKDPLTKAAALCVGGLSPVKEVDKENHIYAFQADELCKSTVATYDPNDPYSYKSPGSLKAGQPFKITCIGGVAKTEVQVKNLSPEFVGATNLGDIAMRDVFARQSTAHPIPAC